MGQVTIRTGQTSRASCFLSPWNGENDKYSVAMINLGNNPISSLEIVSSLNLSNSARAMYSYHYTNRPKKYNPKVYFGAIQSSTQQWLYDIQNDQNPSLGDVQKSGSWLCKSSYK